MKKIYSILLAASVAVSASAEAPKANMAGASVSAVANKAITIERASKATTAVNATRIAHKAAPMKAAPAKAAASTMEELSSFYNFTCYSYGQKKDVNIYAQVKAGEAANEVLIEGFRYSDVTVKGTVDFAAGTITIPAQTVMEEDGIKLDFCKGTVAADNKLSYDNTAGITLTIADGKLTTTDYVAFIRNNTTLAEWIEDIELTVTDEINAKFTAQERDTDEEGTYLDTYTTFSGFTKATFQSNVVVEGENLGDCVMLSDFLYATNAAITKTYPIIIQLEPDTKTVFIDNWNWFDFKLTSLSGTSFICGLTNAGRVDIIEGTYTANTIEWTQDWACVAPSGNSLASFGQFRGCKIELPFSLTDENAGITDVTVENENAPVEYFNLQGMRINEPVAGQIVLRRQGSKTTKVLVK